MQPRRCARDPMRAHRCTAAHPIPRLTASHSMCAHMNLPPPIFKQCSVFDRHEKRFRFSVRAHSLIVVGQPCEYGCHRQFPEALPNLNIHPAFSTDLVHRSISNQRRVPVSRFVLMTGPLFGLAIHHTSRLRRSRAYPRSSLNRSGHTKLLRPLWRNRVEFGHPVCVLIWERVKGLTSVDIKSRTMNFSGFGKCPGRLDCSGKHPLSR